MKLDKELESMVKGFLDDSLSAEYLDSVKRSWDKLEEGKNAFEYFILGCLNGSLGFLFSSYEGKEVSELDTSQLDHIDEILKLRK